MVLPLPSHIPRTTLRGDFGAQHGRSYAHLHRRHIRAGPQDPTSKLRRAFLGWLATLVSNPGFEPSKTRPEDSFSRKTGKGRLAAQIHDTAAINGTDIEDVDGAVRRFVDVYNSPEFLFYRQLTPGGAVSSANNVDETDLIVVGEELVGVDITDAMDEPAHGRR